MVFHGFSRLGDSEPVATIWAIPCGSPHDWEWILRTKRRATLGTEGAAVGKFKAGDVVAVDNNGEEVLGVVTGVVHGPKELGDDLITVQLHSGGGQTIKVSVFPRQLRLVSE